MKRPFLAAASVLLIGLGALPAQADCTAEIRALYLGGPQDPFVRPNRRETTVARHPDGSISPISEVIWDGPVKSRNCHAGGCVQNIGSQSWTAPGPDGPWTPGGDPYGGLPPEEFARSTTDSFAASISAAECLGGVELDGKPMLAYRFSSKTEPNEFGAWWGGNYTLWLDPEARQIVQSELADFAGSWAPEPSRDVQVTTIVTDETIRIDPPQ